MNRILFSSLVAASLLAACQQHSKNDFTVEGTLKHAPANTIYLEEASFSSAQPIIVDSAKLDKDGSFKLHTIGREEGFYNLLFNPNGTDAPVASIINDASEINVKADLSSKEPYTVSGSEASQALKDFLAQTNEQIMAIYHASLRLDSLRNIKASDSLLTIAANDGRGKADAFKTYTTGVVNNSKSAPLTIFALGSYQSYAADPKLGLEPFSQPQMVDLLKKASVKFPQHQGLADVIKSVQSETQQAGATTPAASKFLHQPAPAFTLPDVDGNPVSLSSFKGKYVLVDFWASWCPPCRAENPNVVKMYQKYKDKNFTVLGVSLDRQKAAWQQAIKDDGLTWTHVSDLSYWDSKVVPLYNIEGIPFNVLLDPNGVVIGESLTGKDLDDKLAEVLK